MTAKAHRVFFALWPDDAVRAQISKAITPHINSFCEKQPTARPIPVANFHITLAFIGNVSSETLFCLCEQANKINGQSFSLTLGHINYWSEPKIIWLGCDNLPDGLDKLFHTLQTNLVQCDYHSTNKTYTPHITILRNAKQALPEKKINPIKWGVEQFVLVESLQSAQGTEYKIIKHWAL